MFGANRIYRQQCLPRLNKTPSSGYAGPVGIKAAVINICHAMSQGSFTTAINIDYVDIFFIVIECRIMLAV